MKAIIVTPTNIPFSYMIIDGTKLEDYPFYQALNTPNKHLYIEYDEDNNNLLRVMLDLDQMGLGEVTSVDELERILPLKYHPYDERLDSKRGHKKW